eukprot:7311529-Pyramimonas_sp.AAC.1
MCIRDSHHGGVPGGTAPPGSLRPNPSSASGPQPDLLGPVDSRTGPSAVLRAARSTDAAQARSWTAAAT